MSSEVSETSIFRVCFSIAVLHLSFVRSFEIDNMLNFSSLGGANSSSISNNNNKNKNNI